MSNNKYVLFIMYCDYSWQNSVALQRFNFNKRMSSSNILLAEKAMVLRPDQRVND